MKYKNYNQVIPQEQRKELNEKILYLIDNNLCSKYGIAHEDIYNSYTGDGGLTGLKFNDYESYYSYSEAKKEIENGQFFSPHSLCKFIMNCLKPSKTHLISDLTAGMGNFCNYAPVEENFYLNELDIKAYKVMKYLYPKANIKNEDIRFYNPSCKFDLIVGNPPYNLKWKVNQDEYLSQFYYMLKSYELLKPLGLLCLIMPNSFMNDEFIDNGIIKEVNNKFNFVCQFDLPNNTFKAVGVNNFETKIMIFQKVSEIKTDGNKFTLNKIDIEDLSEESADYIYNTYVKKLYDEKDKLKGKLYFESMKDYNTQEDKEFQYKANKLLFDIKRNPKINQHYGKCESYYQEYYTQKCPEGIKYEEWKKKRITKNKVLAYLKKYLNKQHEHEQDIIKLVKWNYGLKLKAYSRKTQLQLNKLNITKSISFNDMILNEKYPFEDMAYYNLFQKKRNEYLRQSESFKDMQESEQIKKWLNKFEITDYENEELIKLNPIQELDTNLMLNKNYGLIQWECGCGKSITGITQIMYRLENNNIDNAFIVAPAIAINNTWDVILKNYGYQYIRINKLDDMVKIEKGKIVILTFNMLCKYQRFVKKFIKMHNQNVMLLLDESDNISNITSKRAKATLNCFRKVKYKLLTTGTSTRNTIAEIYPQFELLYNNSINMINECETIYKADKKDKDKLKEEYNNYYMCSYPAYNKGLTLFKESHIPERITVFGVGQNTQDIYNSEQLKNLIDKTIITRTFTEVVGKKIYDIKQETCKFNDAEFSLYKQVIDEFYKIQGNYFSSTGNARKDSMLRIIRQLNLMIKVCSVAHTFSEYESKEISSKFKKIGQIVRQYPDERIAIGCKFVKSVYHYYNYLKGLYPNRPIFLITGESATLNQRKSIIKHLQSTSNGILVCTQQSLSSSMNINFVDKVIITETQWNDAVMRQFYFRFIRYNSESQSKKVIFVTYENSIESNLLQLILSKEKLNMFMKDKIYNDEELWEEYGVDFDILNMLMRKERDTEGRVNIRWGQQNIC